MISYNRRKKHTSSSTSKQPSQSRRVRYQHDPLMIMIMTIVIIMEDYTHSIAFFQNNNSIKYHVTTHPWAHTTKSCHNCIHAYVHDKHCFRQWLGPLTTPSHFLNQLWVHSIYVDMINKVISEILVKLQCFHKTILSSKLSQVTSWPCMMVMPRMSAHGQLSLQAHGLLTHAVSRRAGRLHKPRPNLISLPRRLPRSMSIED